MGSLSPTHWLIAIAVLVLLFGANKLPDVARSLGRSARILKAETRGMREDEESAQKETTQRAVPPKDTPQISSRESDTTEKSPTTEQNKSQA